MNKKIITFSDIEIENKLRHLKNLILLEDIQKYTGM